MKETGNWIVRILIKATIIASILVVIIAVKDIIKQKVLSDRFDKRQQELYEIYGDGHSRSGQPADTINDTLRDELDN
jgi:hypothetical protein